MPLWQPSRPARARAQRKLPFSASTHPICPSPPAADANNFIAPRPGLQRCTCSLIAAESFPFTAQISKLPHLQTRGKEHTRIAHTWSCSSKFSIFGACVRWTQFIYQSPYRGEILWGHPVHIPSGSSKLDLAPSLRSTGFPCHAHFKSGQELNTTTWSFF